MARPEPTGLRNSTRQPKRTRGGDRLVALAAAGALLLGGIADGAVTGRAAIAAHDTLATEALRTVTNVAPGRLGAPVRDPSTAIAVPTCAPPSTVPPPTPAPTTKPSPSPTPIVILGGVRPATGLGSGPDAADTSVSGSTVVPPDGGDPRLIPLTAPVVGDAPGLTERESLTSGEAEGHAVSGGPPPPTQRFGPVMSHGGQAISADGRWVAFVSAADDLVEGDTNRTTDVFLRDRLRGTTIRLPFFGGGQLPSRCAAAEPSISANGQVVAFTVYFVAAPTRPVGVFVYDAATGATEVGSTDDGVLFPATQPSISPDGNFLAYARPYSFRRITQTQIFVRDRRRDVQTMVSLIDKLPANGFSRAPAISRDGRFVAFESDAAFDPNDGNQATDIYLLELASGAFARISAGPGGSLGNGDSSEPSISEDGRVVAFASRATNLTDPGVAGPTNQIYVWEAATNAVRLVSLDQIGAHAGQASFSASVSANGNYVAFHTAPFDLSFENLDAPAPGVLPTTGPGDVFLRDLRANLTTQISLDSAGGEVSGDSGHPSVSSDGMATTFDSTSEQLVDGDTNKVGDVFVRDLVAAATVTPGAIDFGTVLLGALAGPQPVTVSSIGWRPLVVTLVERAGANPSDFRTPVNGCAGLSLPNGDSCQVQVTFRTATVGTRTAILRILDNSQTSPHSVRLVGAGGELTLTVDPPIGPPGIVTVVTGTGFPAGGKVALRWNRGITEVREPILVGKDGKFSVGMLVFHHDLIGERTLIATDVGTGSFPTIRVNFLVIQGTVQPPALGPFRFLPATARPIVDRH